MGINAQRVMDDFNDMVRMEGQYQPFKQPANYMSSVGKECARELYYLRAEGDRREPMPVHVLKLFREGKEHERRTKQDLMAMGYDWHEEQSPVAFERLELRGRHDGFVSKGGDKVPTEIKSVSPFLFDRVPDIVEALKEDKYFRKHVKQFVGYLIGLHKDWGLMIYRNRDNGDLKVLEVTADFSLWSEVEAMLKVVNKAVAAGEPPERIEKVGRDDVCRFCSFAHICLPEVRNELGGVQFIDEPEVEARIDRLKELEPIAKEIKELERWKKSRLKGVDGVVVGSYLIEGKEIPRKGYTVKDTTYWQSKITTLKT
jgi:CRISPR/Cas system-associated exonuclease Cas4 (RecB family)